MTKGTVKPIALGSAFLLLGMILSGCVGQAEFDAKVAELGGAKTDLQRAEQATTEANARIETLEAETAELKQQAAKLSEAQQELAAAKDAAEKARNEAQANVVALTEENAELKGQVAKLSQAEQQLAQLRETVTAEKSAMEANIKTLEQENAELRNRIAALQAQTKEAEEESQSEQ